MPSSNCLKSNHVRSKLCFSDKPFDGCLCVGAIYDMHSAPFTTGTILLLLYCVAHRIKYVAQNGTFTLTILHNLIHYSTFQTSFSIIVLVIFFCSRHSTYLHSVTTGPHNSLYCYWQRMRFTLDLHMLEVI